MATNQPNPQSQQREDPAAHVPKLTSHPAFAGCGPDCEQHLQQCRSAVEGAGFNWGNFLAKLPQVLPLILQMIQAFGGGANPTQSGVPGNQDRAAGARRG